LVLIGGQKFFENLRVQLAVGEMRAELALEIVVNLLAVEDFDLLNQPVEAQPKRRIGNVVGVRQILERTGKQDEPLDESHVLVLKEIHPMLFVGIAHLIKLNCSFVLYNSTKLKSTSILLFIENHAFGKPFDFLTADYAD